MTVRCGVTILSKIFWFEINTIPVVTILYLVILSLTLRFKKDLLKNCAYKLSFYLPLIVMKSSFWNDWMWKVRWNFAVKKSCMKAHLHIPYIIWFELSLAAGSLTDVIVGSPFFCTSATLHRPWREKLIEFCSV